MDDSRWIWIAGVAEGRVRNVSRRRLGTTLWSQCEYRALERSTATLDVFRMEEVLMEYNQRG